MKDHTLQRNNTGFSIEINSPYYMEMPTFSTLIKHIEKDPQKCKISCVKNLISVRMEPFGCNKRFVTCKPPGYLVMHLNPTTRGKIVFKINALNRIFPTWMMEGSFSH